jgi:hypothetical protein
MADLEKGGYRIDVICKRVEQKSLLVLFDLVLQLNGHVSAS